MATSTAHFAQHPARMKSSYRSVGHLLTCVSLLRSGIATLIVVVQMTSVTQVLAASAGAAAVTWKEDAKSLTLDNGLFRVTFAKPQVRSQKLLSVGSLTRGLCVQFSVAHEHR